MRLAEGGVNAAVPKPRALKGRRGKRCACVCLCVCVLGGI